MIEDEHHDVNWPRNQFWSPSDGGQAALTRWPHDLLPELTSGLQCVQIPDSKKKESKTWERKGSPRKRKYFDLNCLLLFFLGYRLKGLRLINSIYVIRLWKLFYRNSSILKERSCRVHLSQIGEFYILSCPDMTDERATLSLNKLFEFCKFRISLITWSSSYKTSY